jgi:hypothetical protein
VLRYNIILIPLLLLSVLLQQYLPTFTEYYNARIFLLLAVFLCGSVTISFPIMFLFALGCGFLWDAQCYVGNHSIDLTVSRENTLSMRFGASILLFGLAGAFMHGFRQLFFQKKWLLTCILVGISTYLFMIAEYATLEVIRATFTVNRGVLLQIAYTSLLSIGIAPIIFAALLGLARLFDHSIVETNRRSKSRWST